MSMCLGIASLDDDTLTKVLLDPPLIWKVLAPDDSEAHKSEYQKKRSWFSRLFGKANASAEVPQQVTRPIEETDLDKAWHGIHYMLTKTAWEGEPPLNFLLLGGTEVGDIDVGYGTARAITSDVVAEINEALSGIDKEALRRRFNPSEMMKLQIYPEIWDRASEEDDTFGYCAEYFDELQAFVTRTADQGLGLVIYIS
jgi:hypothetical protein